MIRNVFVSGRLHILYVPEEGDGPESDNLLEALQAQADRIELLEEQNNALIRQEQILLQLLELSSKTGKDIADTLLELKDLLSEKKELKELGEEREALAEKLQAVLREEGKPLN